MSRRVIAVLALLASPAAAEPLTVARSTALSMEVTTPNADWCSPQPGFDLTAPSRETFGNPALSGLIARLGVKLVAAQCPQAASIRLRGLLRGDVKPVWLGTADAASGWTVQAESSAPIDLDAVAPPRTLQPEISNAVDAKPVPLGAVGRARAEAALGNLPGRWNQARRCWLATVRSQGMATTACLSIVKGYTVPTDDGGAQMHLLLQGKGTTDCHACSGLAAFAVVDAKNDKWQPVARPKVEPNGGYGTPNDAKSVVFARLGAARWGWIENSDGFGQGVLEGVVQVHLMRDGLAVAVGDFPGNQNNAGACEKYGTRPGCEQKVDVTVTASPDSSIPQAVAYPIILHAYGTLGRPLDKQARVPFDEHTGRYRAPTHWP